MKTLLDREDSIFNPPQSGCVLSLTGLPGGDGKIYDRSPYGNIGTITGATWVMLPTGLWCLSFDGTDDYVDLGNGKNLDFGTGDFTIECWLKTNNAGNYSAIAKTCYTGAGLWLFRVNTGDFEFFGDDGSMSKAGVFGATVEWKHLVALRRGDAGYLCANATVVASNSSVFSGRTLTNTEHLYLGKRVCSGASQHYLNGIIALVKLYNKALTLIEIQNHFSQEKHLFGVW